MSGWIKLHRQLNQHWLWSDANYLKWWLDILIEVNHAPARTVIKGTIYKCEAGEKLYSYETWAKRWGVNKSKARRFLILLEKDKMIMLKNETQTTRLTVCKYDTYQSNDSKSETQMKRKRNANETQMKTIEEEREEEEGKERNIEGDVLQLFQEEPTAKPKSKFDKNFDKYKLFMVKYNEIKNSPYKGSKNDVNNFTFWLETYTPSEILKAVSNHDNTFWAEKINPQWLFRTKDTKGQPVDYIGQLLEHVNRSKLRV